MKKNLKSCIEQPIYGEPQCLLDMNRYDWIVQAGMLADPRHTKSAQMSAGWRYSTQSRVCIPLGKGDLSPYRYLTFSAFSVSGAGGSFCLQFDNSREGEGKDGYTITLPITGDGWNDYRIELPFMRAMGEPAGWNCVGSICFDCVVGGQANRTETALYFDNFFIWNTVAPMLYTKLPELKGAAAFAKGGNYSIVDRKRIVNSIDATDARPYEENGVLWVPMGTVAAGIAHSAVADNLAMTLSFTYRRKKYIFEARKPYVRVDGELQALEFAPAEKNGTLFFPVTYVRDFFRWRQIFIDPMGLIVLSNRKNVFDRTKQESVIWSLVADMTFCRPTDTQIMDDMKRRYSNPARGRLLLSFDDWMKLRKAVKTDCELAELLNLWKARYGTASEAFKKSPIREEQTSDTSALIASCEALVAFASLFRLTGDKKYAERALLEAEGFASMSAWNTVSTELWGEISLAMTFGYDWCMHVWSEGKKALLERAMLRNAMRPMLELYDGKGKMWRSGSAVNATMNASALALSLALVYAYPETAKKLIDRVVRNAEECFSVFAPDGGNTESMLAWERTAKGSALLVAMLENACRTDYGFASAPGFLASAYLPIFGEGAKGAWNYHDCKAEAIDTSILSYFSLRTSNPVPAWMRRQQLLRGDKEIKVWDLVFYQNLAGMEPPALPLDAVYRKAGLAVMRSDWKKNAMLAGLHGGYNHAQSVNLDAGSVILECEGERFFSSIGGNEAFPEILRRRAAGQNTFVINPPSELLPDQNPEATAPIVAMKSGEDRAFAIVDMTATNDSLVRAKRGVMLTENRSVAVIQDELTLSENGEYVFGVWTEAEVDVNKSGRMAKLTVNGKTMVCRLAGVGSPAKIEAVPYQESGFTRLEVRVPVKNGLRVALVCRMLKDGETGSEKYYDMTPISRWGEIE